MDLPRRYRPALRPHPDSGLPQGPFRFGQIREEIAFDIILEPLRLVRWPKTQDHVAGQAQLDVRWFQTLGALDQVVRKVGVAGQFEIGPLVGGNLNNLPRRSSPVAVMLPKAKARQRSSRADLTENS